MKITAWVALAAAALFAAGCSSSSGSSSSSSGSTTTGTSGTSAASTSSTSTSSTSGGASSGSGSTAGSSGSTGGSSGSSGSSGTSGAPDAGQCIPGDGGADFDAGPGLCTMDYGGEAIEYDGGSPGPINSIWGTGGSQLVAVGGTGNVYTFDGSSWTTTNISSSASLSGVWAASASDIWVVGSGGFVRHFDGSSWTTPPGDSTNIALYAVSGSSTDNVIMVGYTPGGASVGLRWDGSRLSLMPSFPIRSACPVGAGTADLDVRGVWVYDRSDAWAVGQCGYLAKWDGCAWTRQPTNRYDDFITIRGTGPSNIYIAGGNAQPTNGVVLQFDGTTWNQLFTGQTMRDIFVRGTHDIWVAGGDSPYASILRGGERPDGGPFMRYVQAPNNAPPLHAVWSQDDCTTWLGGGDLLTAP